MKVKNVRLQNLKIGVLEMSRLWINAAILSQNLVYCAINDNLFRKLALYTFLRSVISNHLSVEVVPIDGQVKKDP